jgi:hypothetical protein
VRYFYAEKDVVQPQRQQAAKEKRFYEPKLCDHFLIDISQVSGMKEELNVVGNQYQTFTAMWAM